MTERRSSCREFVCQPGAAWERCAKVLLELLSGTECWTVGSLVVAPSPYQCVARKADRPLDRHLNLFCIQPASLLSSPSHQPPTCSLTANRTSLSLKPRI